MSTQSKIIQITPAEPGWQAWYVIKEGESYEAKSMDIMCWALVETYSSSVTKIGIKGVVLAGSSKVTRLTGSEKDELTNLFTTEAYIGMTSPNMRISSLDFRQWQMEGRREIQRKESIVRSRAIQNEKRLGPLT